MANFTVGYASIGSLQRGLSGGAFRGVTVIPAQRGRVISYSAYVSDVDTDDTIRLGVGKTAAMLGTTIELMPNVTGQTINPGWFTQTSVVKPILEAGETYVMYVGMTGNSGVGNTTTNMYYDNPVAPEIVQAFTRNGATTLPVTYLEQDGVYKYSAYMLCAPVFDNNYYYRKEISTDHTKVAGADYANFPLIVSLTDTALRTVANGGKVQSANGYDIRFEDIYGNKLAHEMESWSATTGAIVAHVKLPTLYTATNTRIYMYYGNPDVTATEENPTAVWTSDYKAVYHLGLSADKVSKPMFVDTFTAANGTLLTAYNPARYYKIAGSSDMAINNNRIQPGSAYPNKHMWLDVFPSNDQYAQATYLRTTYNQHAFLAIRSSSATDFQAASSYTAFLEWGGGGTRWISLYRYIGGVATEVVRYYKEFSLNVEHVFRVQAIGANVKVIVDGVTYIDYTDPSPLTGSYGGFDFIANGTDPNYMDNLEVGTMESGVFDSTSNNNDMEFSPNFPVPTTGKVDGAYDLELDNSNYMRITNAQQTGLNLTTSFTISAWINLESIGPNASLIFGKQDDGSITKWQYEVFVNGGSSTVNALVTDGTNYDYYTGFSVTTGVWTHVTVTCNTANPSATTFSFYKNGIFQGNGSPLIAGNISTIQSTTTDAVIGARQTNGVKDEFFDGIIDDVRVSDSVLNADQIVTLYENSNSPATFYTVGSEMLPDSTTLSTWSYARKLTINANEVYGSTPFTNFQVFYETTLPELKSISNGGHVFYENGKDIVFGGSSDPSYIDRYDFQISEYNPVTGYLAAYINIPSIDTSLDTNFYMLYGNETVMNTFQNVMRSERGWSGASFHGNKVPQPTARYYAINDTFTGTSGTLLTTYNPIYQFAGGTNNGYIANNKLRSNGTGEARYGVNASLNTNNMVVEADVTMPSGVGGATYGLYIRKDSPTGFNDYYTVVLTVPSGTNPTATLTITRYLGNAPTVDGSTTFQVFNGATSNFKAVVNGDRLRVFWNTALVYTTSSVSAIPGGMYGGLIMNGPSGFVYGGTDAYAWDNFKVYAYTAPMMIQETRGIRAIGAGETLETESPTVGVGKVNKAYYFSGDDFLRSFNPFENNFATPTTVMAWVMKTSGTNVQTIAFKGADTSTNLHSLYGITNSTNLPFIATNGSSTPDLTGVTPISLNTWTHWTFIIGNDGIYRIYVNGVLDASASGKDTNWSTGNTGTPSIGSYHTSTYGGAITGRLDEIHVEPGALRTADFIRTHYSNTNAPATFISTGNETSPGGGGGWVIFGDEGLIA